MGDKLKSSWRRRRRTCLLGRDGVLHEGKPAVPPPSLPGRGRCHAAAFSLTLSRAPARRTEDGGERSEARGRGDGLAASPCSSRLRRSGARSARTPPPHCRSRKSRYSSRLCAPLCARSDRPTDRPCKQVVLSSFRVAQHSFPLRALYLARFLCLRLRHSDSAGPKGIEKRLLSVV